MKQWQIPLITFAVLYVSLALAEDFKTTNGKEYKNATVTLVEPDGITLRSKSGVSKVYFNERPKEVQERFHYDPQKAAAASAEQGASIQQANQPCVRPGGPQRISIACYLYTATLLPKGMVLAAGGHVSYPYVSASAEMYDSASDTWTPTGSLNTERAEHTATLLPNGMALVAGGSARFDGSNVASLGGTIQVSQPNEASYLNLSSSR